MSSCSSRMSESSRSSGPENDETSTTKPVSVVVANASGTYAWGGVIGWSGEPLGKVWQRVRPEQSADERIGRPLPQAQDVAPKREKQHQDHDTISTDLLVPDRQPQRQQIL